MKVRSTAQLRQEITRFFAGRGYEPLPTAKLAEHFGLDLARQPEFLEILHELEEQGHAVHLDGRGWYAPAREGWKVGTLSVARRGFGFVRLTGEAPGDDVFIPASKLKDAHDGDLVLVKLGKPRRARRGGRESGPDREGRILATLRRSRRVLVGVFRALSDGGGVVEPLLHDTVREVSIGPGLTADARDGDRVLARLREGPLVDGLPPGEVLDRCAPEGTWRADLQVVVAEYELSETFPAECEAAAAALPGGITPEDEADRTDYRDALVFTIDPDDAKDFDDAVTLSRTSAGGFRLGVFIADVSHFVTPESAIDREAYRRATSIYLPGLTIPMLPERLSNDLCSLRPQEDRLAKVVWMDLDAEGELEAWTVERCLMRSCRRFTYREAQELLDGGTAEPGEEPLCEMLHLLEALRRLRRECRTRRGALDLAIEEQRLSLDAQGEVLAIGPYPRLGTHSLIEEMMLLANEAVARLATERSIPIIRRAHPAPDEDDLEAFLRLCRALVPGKPPRDIREVQRMLERIRDQPIEPILNYTLLRCMARAEYVPEAAQHFALALDEYCHFTSPIRRYADLQVHRALDRAVFGRSPGRARVREGAEPPDLEEMAEHCSVEARQAEEAERELARLRAIAWLRPQVDQHFRGLVVAIRAFGFFVRLDDTLIEGLVHLSRMKQDFYDLHEDTFMLRGRRSGHTIRLGDRIEVRLDQVDSLRRQVDFEYVKSAPA